MAKTQTTGGNGNYFLDIWDEKENRWKNICGGSYEYCLKVQAEITGGENDN
jgi:hypothetical protein